MKDQTSKFVDYCNSLYHNLNKFPVDLSLTRNSSFESFLNSISGNIGANKLRTLYRKSINDIIDSRLELFKDDLELIRQLKEVKYYENSISIYASFLIFWIKENKLEISLDNINKLSTAILTGTFGFSLLDLNQDHGLFDSRIIVLSLSLINMFEKLLLEVSPADSTFEVIKKHIHYYCEVEYLEKANRWKTCPFMWENAVVLSNKAAPLFAILEILFRKKGFDDQRINSLLSGWRYLVSSTQLCDDITDAKEDLQNGFETLVMSGYYSKYGTKSAITEKSISDHLSPERMKLYYETNVNCFNISREIFKKYNEDLFLLYLEIQYYQFNNSFEL